MIIPRIVLISDLFSFFFCFYYHNILANLFDKISFNVQSALRNQKISWHALLRMSWSDHCIFHHFFSVWTPMNKRHKLYAYSLIFSRVLGCFLSFFFLSLPFTCRLCKIFYISVCIYVYISSMCVCTCTYVCMHSNIYFQGIWVDLTCENAFDTMHKCVFQASPCVYMFVWRCPWCNGYRHRKWTWWHEFKSWMRLIAFHITLIPLGKVWIQLFSLQHG